MRLRFLIPCCFICLSLFACKEKQKSASAQEKAKPVQRLPVEDTTQTHFSTRDYLKEQWKFKSDQPYTLLKVVKTGKKSDSSYVPLDSAAWFTMLQPFVDADISSTKYLGWYRTESYKDEENESLQLNYTAVSPDAFVQKTNVTANQYSGMVLMVYIETQKKEGNVFVSQKMQYRKDEIIQIIAFSKEDGKAPQESVTEYRFKY